MLQETGGMLIQHRTMLKKLQKVTMSKKVYFIKSSHKIYVRDIEQETNL